MKAALSHNKPTAPPKRNINLQQRAGNDIFNVKGSDLDQQKPMRKQQDNLRKDTCPWGKPVYDQQPKQVRQPAENNIYGQQQQEKPQYQGKKADICNEDEELMRYAQDNGLSKDEFSELVRRHYGKNNQAPQQPQVQQQPKQPIQNNQKPEVNENDEELINYAIENGLSREQFQELAANKYGSKQQPQKSKPQADISNVDPEILKYGIEKGLSQDEIVQLMEQMKIKDDPSAKQYEQVPVQQPQQAYQQKVQPQRAQQQQMQQQQQQQIKQSNIRSNILAHDPVVQKKEVFKGINCPFAQISDHQSVQGQFSSKSTDKIGNQNQAAFDYSANQQYQERRQKMRQGNNIFG